jgi:CRP-like cAMP-binding protein
MGFQTGAEAPKPAAGVVRPRRRPASPPPAPHDPAPWQAILGGEPLAADEFDLLTRLTSRREITAGDVVLTGGEPIDGLLLILRGDVVLGVRDPASGTFRTERSLTGPAWLDLSSAWLRLPAAVEALALSDVTLAALPLPDLRAHMGAYPGLILRLCAALARQVQDLSASSRNLIHHQASVRFAQWLLHRCPATEAGLSTEVRLQERKRDIAHQLGMTPETLSRLIRSLEQQGVIQVDGYVVHIPDMGALRALCS